MKNAAPRFGLEHTPEGARLFCYLTSRYYPVGELCELPDGVWDTQKVAELIESGQLVEGGRVRTPAAVDKVEQAKADFLGDPATSVAGQADVSILMQNQGQQAERGTDANGSSVPPADVAGAMASQEAQPKAE